MALSLRERSALMRIAHSENLTIAWLASIHDVSLGYASQTVDSLMFLDLVEMSGAYLRLTTKGWVLIHPPPTDEGAQGEEGTTP